MVTLQKISTPGTTFSLEVAPSLGALLHQHRAEVGQSAKAVSRISGLGLVEISQIELGRSDLSAEQLAKAVEAYAVPRVLFPEGRCEARVDLAAGSVSIHLADTEIQETSADRVLLTYFELAFAGTAITTASPVPFTTLDLDVLRLVLSSRRNEVTQHLHRIVGPIGEPAVTTGHGMRRAILLLAAAVTTLAAAIIVQHAASSDQTPVAPIEVQIIDAVVVTRG